ncbi:methionine gamma-lyase [Kaistia sp. 32K]|uniref:trans-sulfuration enzyme family protein n=1 Tax=Kaistia sp. 32K TaxID=2795690 RepID=UPI0019169AC9|nr:aminotransferase class I/II-fold pyridoxal phosphate-dependent enzyme [Kaistia sp. 32K]BCP51508.1 methionine gamma-lyase [Kaistia sp. 32K]
MSKTPPSNRPGFATRAIHEGYDPKDEKGALVPPVFMTSTYAFDTVEDGGAAFRGERNAYIYGRTKNPTQTVLESRLASLEGAEAAVATASGMSAISATFFSLFQQGDRILVHSRLYGNSFAFFGHLRDRFGFDIRLIDMTEPGELEAAAAEGAFKAVYFETPANPMLDIVDIEAVSALAHRHGAISIVDNTFATPYLQRPLEQGADLVLHSATKYLGGHGDLIAGIVAGSEAHVKQIRQIGLRVMTGATMAPLTAHLILRGLKTLELRMERHSSSALTLAERLSRHPAIAQVIYPGLAGTKGHAIASRQMSGYGGLIGFYVDGDYDRAAKLCNRLQLSTIAVSLGDAETLVQHPASMTHSTYPKEEREKLGLADNLIRVSVGLETAEDIVADFDAALAGLR